MKAAEILRSLVDLLDKVDQGQEEQSVVVNINNGQSDTVDEPVDDNVGTFVPPLQQKIELMKKSQGVESIYDQPEQDELDIVKRIAGIKPLDVLSDDEDGAIEG